EFGDRHELDEGHPERSEVVELVERSAKRAARSERADVKLVDDGLVPRSAAPTAVAPHIGARVDDPARAVRVVVCATCRVGHDAAVDPTRIEATHWHRCLHAEATALFPLHRY